MAGTFDSDNACTAPTSVGFGVTGPGGTVNEASEGTRASTLTACVSRSSFPFRNHRSESTRPTRSMQRSAYSPALGLAIGSPSGWPNR